jgi:riboflavin kinase / FMN adenylyltransferase
MEIFRGSWSSFADVRDSAITVGLFDGLHRGHRAILDVLTQAAKAQSLRSVVLTFDTHPRDVLREGAIPVPLLTTLEEKLELLAAAKVDLTMVLQFDQTLAKMSPADFVQIILKGRIGMRKIVVGFNHGFGKDRAGDRETLIAMTKSLGFSVDVVNPAHLGEAIVSSTYLRELISRGDVAQAADGLGRFYSVRGIIVHGMGRGKRLHWPTANLGAITAGKLCPRDGIYAGLAYVRGETHPAAISSGFNPTFAEGRHSVEAHLIGFDDDIYDELLEISFVDHLRTEKKFTSEQELSAQIAEDVRHAEYALRERGLFQTMPRKSGQPNR